jgi:signal transduction histidine kinase
VGDLLDLAREREGTGLSVDTRPMDRRAMCQHIVEEVRPLAKGRQVTFDCEADGHGAWDEHRILQAISNLASNAVQHGTPGSPLGLFIVKAVAVAHGGALELDSSGGGTTFRLLLPRTSVAQPAA